MKRFLASLLLLWSFFVCAADPIQVVPGGSITISATASSAATALPTAGTDTVRNLELQNNGTSIVFVETGISTVTATVAASYPVLPGQCKVITIQRTHTHIATITASGTQTLYVTVGTGN